MADPKNIDVAATAVATAIEKVTAHLAEINGSATLAAEEKASLANNATSAISLLYGAASNVATLAAVDV